jgi:hypothetical protein
MSLTREFTVEGIIECLFTPEVDESSSVQAGIEVQVWYKGPLNVFLLGSGPTDADGKFSITFNTDQGFVVDGKIPEAFLKVYYKGILVTGNNPYLA